MNVLNEIMQTGEYLSLGQQIKFNINFSVPSILLLLLLANYIYSISIIACLLFYY